MRCFVAWNPPQPTRDALLALVGSLAAERSDPGYRWTREDQLHLTMRFLGDSTPAQLDAIGNALAPIAREQPPIDAYVAGWQYWPSSAAPHVLVLRIESERRLESFAAKIESLAQSAGFAAERRPFRAHLTLARIGPLRERPQPFTAPPPRIALGVDHLALMRSEPTDRGSRYTVLAHWPLAAEMGPGPISSRGWR